ncbi:ABC transporter permease [Mangrovicoccus ximenensis]|uniref:ABC transporter permease n=1 Tax=Mangrovicoccus ximenensis TaxID=1911570 RepID=UPI000D3D7B3C|nr:ABC transporter permease [Mangrovicoccus ximenensis]
MKLSGVLWALLTGAVLLFLLAPVAVLIFSAFDDGKFFRFPPRELSLRWFGAALDSPEYRGALINSTIIACVSTAISVTAGLMAATGLSRGGLKSRALVELLLLAPLTLPLVVWAIALLQIYARLGISGTFGGLVLAHAVITLPLSVRILLATLAGIDPQMEEAARSLGARPLRAFLRTTFPLALPGVLTAAVFSFLVSFNDVVVTTFIAGARWMTFPVRMYSQLRGQGVDPITLAIGAMIVALILAAVIAGELKFKWSRRL